MPTRKRNISHVQRAGLCHLCGTCYAVCPHDNIELTWGRNEGYKLWVKDASLCERCGLCLRVCPGAQLDLRALNKDVFGSVPDDMMIGHVRGVYLSRAARDDIRLSGASGGTVGALMRYLLEKGLVRGVRASRMGTPDEPLRPHGFIARSVEDLAGSGGSIYQMAPGNATLRGAVEAGVRLACVGLGCQVRGLRKAANLLKAYREGIELVIGLFCGHNAEPAGTQHLMGRLGVSPSRVAGIRYRAGRHPGCFQVKTRGGSVREIPFRKFTYILTLFEHYRCGLCTDPLNTLADISIGDGWLPEIAGEGGWNVLIVRTTKGQELFDCAVADGAIRVRPADIETVRNAQSLVLYRRNRCGEARARILQLFGKEMPLEVGLVRERPRRKDYIRALEQLIPQWLFSSPMRRGLFAPLVRLMLMLDEATSWRKDKSAGRSREWLQQFKERKSRRPRSSGTRNE